MVLEYLFTHKNINHITLEWKQLVDEAHFTFKTTTTLSFAGLCLIFFQLHSFVWNAFIPSHTY